MTQSTPIRIIAAGAPTPMPIPNFAPVDSEGTAALAELVDDDSAASAVDVAWVELLLMGIEEAAEDRRALDDNVLSITLTVAVVYTTAAPAENTSSLLSQHEMLYSPLKDRCSPVVQHHRSPGHWKTRCALLSGLGSPLVTRSARFTFPGC